MTAVLDADVSHGSLTLDADGSFLYAPTNGYSGADSFTYHANDGTLDSNVVTVSIGVGNNALELGGASYVLFGDPAKLDLAQFTIETWFKWDGTGTSNTTGSDGIPNLIPLLTHGAPQADDSNVDANWILGINTVGNVIAADFEAIDDPAPTGQNNPISGTTEITVDVWHHAAATFNGTTWAVYLDGNLQASTNPGVHPRSDSIQRVALGAMVTSTGTVLGRFGGVIDEARVWDHARTGSEILASKNSELTGGTGMVARWGLNEAFGTTVMDSVTSPTAAVGTIVGGAQCHLGRRASSRRHPATRRRTLRRSTHRPTPPPGSAPRRPSTSACPIPTATR